MKTQPFHVPISRGGGRATARRCKRANSEGGRQDNRGMVVRIVKFHRQKSLIWVQLNVARLTEQSFVEKAVRRSNIKTVGEM